MGNQENTEQERAEFRGKAMQLYEAPFKFESGYIFDAKGRMVSDDNVEQESQVARVRGWGRISYLPNAESLQDEVGAIIADALTTYWQAARRAPVVPQGWKLVPMVADEKMQRAIAAQFSGTAREALDAWSEALAAAPQPPAAQINCENLDQLNKNNDLEAQVECVCGDSYSVDSFGAGFIAASGKCPNCDAAESGCSVSNAETMEEPVQLPEPTAYLYHDAPTLEDYIANERAGIPINSACIGVKRMPHCRNETPLYTEHQVRQLLQVKTTANADSTSASSS